MNKINELLEYKKLLDEHKKEVREELIESKYLRNNILDQVHVYTIQGVATDDVETHVRFNLNGKEFKASTTVEKRSVSEIKTDSNEIVTVAVKGLSEAIFEAVMKEITYTISE